MARPRLPDAKREKIELRVNRAQKEQLQEAARQAGMPTATWILKLVLAKSAN